MILFEKMYVGISGQGQLSTTDFPLGFGIPLGDTAAFRKQKQTVDKWAGSNVEYEIDPATGAYKRDSRGRAIPIAKPVYAAPVIVNEPMEGFSVEKSVSRWSTSNKLFRVNDPRGFTLEITTENLCDLLLNTTVINGVFQCKLLWTRFGSGNYLTRLDHPEYIKETNPQSKAKPVIGDLVESSSNKYIYAGKVYVASISRVVKYFNHTTQKYDLDYEPYRGVYYGTFNGGNKDPQVSFKIDRDPKPWELLKLDGTIPYYEGRFQLLRSFGKTYNVISHNHIFEEPKWGEATGKIRSMDYHKQYIVFKTKDDMLSAIITEKDYVKST